MDGYIFINSHYVGKPDTIYAKYLTYTDAIIYSNEYIMGMKLHDDYTDVEMVIPNSTDDVDTIMLSGLKSIGGIKVIQSSVEMVESVDFEVDYILGKIKILSTGSIDNTADFDVFYNYWTNDYYTKTGEVSYRLNR